MKYNEIITKVSQETGLPGKVVDKVFKAYWFFIRTSLQALPLKEISSEEDFSKLKTNFNIPSLGKLTCTYEDYLRQKKRHEHIIAFRKKNGIKNQESKASL